MEENLATFVRKLHTSAGKAAAVSKAIGKGMSVEPHLLGRYGIDGANDDHPQHPFALLAAEHHNSLGSLAQFEGKTRNARRHYTLTLRGLIEAREYLLAYELAEEQRLLPEFKRQLRRRLPYLEANGMFEDCAQIEAILGNEESAKMYSKGVSILKT